MPSTDPVTSITTWYRLILAQYHQVSTFAVLLLSHCCPSTQLHHLVTLIESSSNNDCYNWNSVTILFNKQVNTKVII